MPKNRLWITCAPASKGLVQTAIDVAGYGNDIGDSPENSSWIPYPSSSDIKLYYVAGVWDTTIATALGAVILAVIGTRVRLGKLRGTDPALTMAQAQASFPLPNVGPPGSTVVTQKCAMWLHYRDLLPLVPFDDIGSPDAIEGPPLGAVALADLVRQVQAEQVTKVNS